MIGDEETGRRVFCHASESSLTIASFLRPRGKLLGKVEAVFGSKFRSLLTSADLLFEQNHGG